MLTEDFNNRIYILKKETHFIKQACSKSSKVYAPIIWHGCIRIDSIRNRYSPFK